MRNTFINSLVQLARLDPDIYLIVGDLGFSAIEPFADEFPERFLNAGIAEQNMAGLAAGMASEGAKPFCYSIANFPTFRCAEQIRNDICYHNLPVTIVAVGGGLAYGNLGYSHHAIQDYALLRTLPNMKIAAAADPIEVKALTENIIANPGPRYLRLGKTGEKNIHQNQDIQIVDGFWQEIRPSLNKRCFLTTGAIAQHLIPRIEKDASLNDDGIYTVPLWSKFGKSEQATFLRKFESVEVYEDHLIDGGFGSWVLEAANLIPELKCKIKINGIGSSTFDMVGDESFLLNTSGLFNL